MEAGKILIVAGAVLVVAGLAMLAIQKAGLPSMPGDLSFRRGNLRVFVPIGTSIVISIVLTILLNVFFRR